MTKKTQITKIANKALKDFNTTLSSVGYGSSSLNKTIKYKTSGTLITYYYDEYGDFLDSGTKPHRPPIEGLRLWAKEKGLNVYAVAAGIEKRGTKAHPWLNKLEKKMLSLDLDVLDYGYVMIEQDFESNLIRKGFKIQ